LPDTTQQPLPGVIRRTENWTKEGRALQVEVYGDAAAQPEFCRPERLRHHSGRLQERSEISLAIPHPIKNPLIRDRINAVNATLCIRSASIAFSTTGDARNLRGFPAGEMATRPLWEFNR